MALLNRCAQRLAEPVGVNAREHVLQLLLVQLPLVNGFATLNVYSSLKFGIELFLCVHEVVARQVGSLDTHFAAVSHPDAARFRSLALDYYNAIGSTRTVDGCGSCVFQNDNRLHAVGVEVGKRLYGDFKTVHDEQRLVGVSLVLALHGEHVLVGAEVHIGTATHTHVGQVVRIRARKIVVHYVKSGRHGGNRLCNVVGTEFLQVLALDSYCRTGKSFLLTIEHTRNHNVVEQLAVRLQRHLHLNRRRYRGGSHSDVRDYQFAVRCDVCQFETSLGVSHGLQLAASHLDAGANYGQSVVSRQYDTLYGWNGLADTILHFCCLVDIVLLRPNRLWRVGACEHSQCSNNHLAFSHKQINGFSIYIVVLLKFC